MRLAKPKPTSELDVLKALRDEMSQLMDDYEGNRFRIMEILRLIPNHYKAEAIFGKRFK